MPCERCCKRYCGMSDRESRNVPVCHVFRIRIFLPASRTESVHGWYDRKTGMNTDSRKLKDAASGNVGTTICLRDVRMTVLAECRKRESSGKAGRRRLRDVGTMIFMECPKRDRHRQYPAEKSDLRESWNNGNDLRRKLNRRSPGMRKDAAFGQSRKKLYNRF